jgi:hypothetical protein
MHPQPYREEIWFGSMTIATMTEKRQHTTFGDDDFEEQFTELKESGHPCQSSCALGDYTKGYRAQTMANNTKATQINNYCISFCRAGKFLD